MPNPGPRYFRWVHLHDKDQLRWIPGLATPGHTTPFKKYRVYALTDTQRELLKEVPAEPWGMELDAAWRDKRLTVVGVTEQGEESGPSIPPEVTILSPESECWPQAKTPTPWLRQHPESEQTRMVGTSYYKSWLVTTTTRCSDLFRLVSDNKIHHITSDDQLVWRTDGRMLFHGDEEQRAPEEVFQTGLTPPEPLGLMTMRPGSHIGALESFSYSFMLALAYTNDTFGQSGASALGYVYLADPPGGLMVDASLKSANNDGDAEVAFPGGVRTEWIRGAYAVESRYVDSNNIKTLVQEIKGYQANPHYAKTPPAVGMVDVIVSCWEPGVKITLTPGGETHTVRVKEGTPVKVALAYQDGEQAYAQWYINNEGIPRGHAPSLTVTASKSNSIGQTIIVGASKISRKRASYQGSNPGDDSSQAGFALTLNEKMHRPSEKDEGQSQLSSAPGPLNLSVTYTVDKPTNKLVFHAQWDLPDDRSAIASYHLYEFFSVNGDVYDFNVTKISDINKSKVDVDGSIDPRKPYYVHYFSLVAAMKDGTQTGYSIPAHPIAAP